MPSSFDNEPNNHGAHLGSAYQDGWYGYATRTCARFSAARAGCLRRRFCGDGDLAACRAALVTSLKAALAVSRRPSTPTTSARRRASRSSQTCFDKVLFRPLGAITQPLMPWINRPDVPAGDGGPGARSAPVTGGGTTGTAVGRRAQPASRARWTATPLTTSATPPSSAAVGTWASTTSRSMVAVAGSSATSSA